MADLTTSKMLWNSTIRTEGARYNMCSNISGFCVETPLSKFEYMKMSMRDILQAFQDIYSLNAKTKNGFIYMCIQKGMYGLAVDEILANKLLKYCLAKKGYFELPHTPDLWKHVPRPIFVTIVVDDFGIKYKSKEHADHLLAALIDYYKIENDWEGKLYWDQIRVEL